MHSDQMPTAGEAPAAPPLHERELVAKTGYDRRLFEMAPVPLVVTTPTGLITEANRAATLLLGHDAFQLERRALVEFLPAEERQEFRTRLERLELANDVTHWRFRVLRRRNVPLAVSAIVCVVGGLNRLSTSPGLFWCFKTATEDWLPGTYHLGGEVVRQ